MCGSSIVTHDETPWPTPSVNRCQCQWARDDKTRRVMRSEYGHEAWVLQYYCWHKLGRNSSRLDQINDCNHPITRGDFIRVLKTRQDIRSSKIQKHRLTHTPEHIWIPKEPTNALPTSSTSSPAPTKPCRIKERERGIETDTSLYPAHPYTPLSP